MEGQVPHKTTWTLEDDDILAQLYSAMHQTDIAARLKRTHASVVRRARFLKLKRTKKQITSPRTPTLSIKFRAFVEDDLDDVLGTY
jgi:hypothetical protein